MTKADDHRVRAGQLWAESISWSYIYIVIGPAIRQPTLDMHNDGDRWWRIMFMDGSTQDCPGSDIMCDELLEDVTND